jgi:uncharacterized peroxidase-related enzyme
MSFVKRITRDQESVSEILRPYARIAGPLSELTEHVLRGSECAFSVAERELIGAFVSGVNACTFCCDTHQAAAEAMGVPAGVLDALLLDIGGAPVDDRLKPVLRFVRKLTLMPTRMVQADADAVFAAGWDERDFHYAIMICGLFNFYNRMLEGYGAKNTADFRLTAGRDLAQTGYLHVAEIADKEGTP